MSLHGERLCLGFFCGARLCFGSNALPISLNILSYPLTQQRGKNLHTSGLEPSILCILTSRLNHYATILDFRHCLLLVYVTDAGAAADTRRRHSQQREQVLLLRRCWPANATDSSPAPPPPSPLPAPADTAATGLMTNFFPLFRLFRFPTF